MKSDYDIHLLEQARCFDQQALAKVYDTFSPGIYAYAMRLLGDAPTAEDCVSETFSRLLQALRVGKGPQEYLQAYLYRIAHNWITDYYRRSPAPPLSIDEAPAIQSPERTEQAAIEAIQREQVRAALLRLTPEQRQVVMLKFVEGWENQAIASALQKPIGAVKALQHRAVEALKRILVIEN